MTDIDIPVTIDAVPGEFSPGQPCVILSITTPVTSHALAMPPEAALGMADNLPALLRDATRLCTVDSEGTDNTDSGE